ncbi:hypothetical protein VPHD148_0077 [Vibrio phage D148]
MNSLFEKAKRAAFSALPASVSPENQYAKSYASLLCLGVSADFEFDVAEFNQAANFMEQDAILTSTSMTLRAVEFFRGYANAITEVMSDKSLDFPTVQTEMIYEVRQCPEEYKHHLRHVISTLRSVSGPKEIAIFDRINL